MTKALSNLGMPRWDLPPWTALRTIRLQLRFLVPLLVTLIVASWLAVPLLDQVTLRWFSRDLNSRGVLVANALSDSVVEALETNRLSRLDALFERAAQDERLFAAGLCSTDGAMLKSTARFPRNLACATAMALAKKEEPRLSLEGGPVHVGVQDITGKAPIAGAPKPPPTSR